MMKQYLSCKERYPHDILFFRMGDFYEMFFDDARVAADILGIALTSRNKDREAVPMAGVPVRAVDAYLARLLEAGRRVAICEQVQDPKDATGLVEREVVRVVSPGTVVDEKFVNERSNNYLASLWVDTRGTGLAWVDVTTGEFLVWESPSRQRVLDQLSRLEPAECVLPEQLYRNAESEPDVHAALEGVFRTSLSDWFFDHDTAYSALIEHFGTRTLEGYGCEHLRLAIQAAGALIHYLRDTQKDALRHLRRVRPFPATSCMVLDRATRSALEITHGFREGQRGGTLLAALDRTLTSMGARRFREWLLTPLQEVDRIVYRQEAVGELVASGELRGRVVELLKQVHDLERIATRISYSSATARDLVHLRHSLEILPELSSALGASECRFFRDRLTRFGDFSPFTERVARTLRDDPPLTVREGGLVRAGFSEELDRLRDMTETGTRWMAEFQAREAEATGISSLKIGFNKVFGYYIEITNTHAQRVPTTYVRKQTLKNCERYITPELKDFENQILHARENAEELEYRVFVELRDHAAELIGEIQAAAEAVAEIDAVSSLARIAAERGYVRPQVHDGDRLEIVDGRHPVLETVVPTGEFVSNSVSLTRDEPIMLITGPNMAGKSTYIRQVALLVLMAQVGSFVPAESAEIGVVDRVFTRVGAADDISRGQSTFMVEMHETANIINNATDRSLLIFDEVGRGTSTFDGISLAWAITEHVAETLRARTLFATHYHELTELTLTTPLVRNFTFSVREWNEEIVFLRRVVEGAADKSYGIHVARLAGLPRSVLDRAREILANLEAQSLDLQGQPAFAPTRRRPEGPAETGAPDRRRRTVPPDRDSGAGDGEPPDEELLPLQLDLFQNANEPLLRELKALDVERLTPLDALVYLAELRKRIV